MQRQRFLALALAAAGLMAVTSPASAQEAGRTFDPIGRILAHRGDLAITDDQARRLEAIRSKYREKNQPLVERLRRQRAARDSAWRADTQSRAARQTLRANMDSARAEVLAVLTPEQETKLKELRRERRKEWRAERHARRHERWHHHHEKGGGRGAPRGETADSAAEQ